MNKSHFFLKLLFITGALLLSPFLFANKITIILGEGATVTDELTAKDLKADFLRIGLPEVSIRTWQGQLPDGELIVLGTVGKHSLLSELISSAALNLSMEHPGARGGLWSKVEYKDRELVVLAGSDEQGTQYSVYDYSREILGIDPLSYWTGIEPEPRSNLNIRSFSPRTIPPPQVPYLIYFENDVDELANLKKPYLEYDWQSYKALIDALVRLRYNGIELFDMLGRPEFFERPEYKKVRPDYALNLPLLEKMIDYAQQKGMYIQVDTMLGRPFKKITMEESNCWKKHKKKWIETWHYYLSETPIAKADIYTLRPRNQVLDWPYKSSCGENRVEVFNEVYKTFGNIVSQHRPNAVKVLVAYDDGMELYNEGFRPPKDFIVAWPDDGWGGFRLLPKSTQGFRFGTYMHAGFWLNHDVHDPYPLKIDAVMNDFFEKYRGDQYLMVNGQTFRPFMINLQAFSEVAYNGKAFDGETFYRNWLARYFDRAAIEPALQSLKLLHQAQFNNVGYVQNLWEIKSAEAWLQGLAVERPGKTPIPVNFATLQRHIDDNEKRLELIQRSLTAAQKGLKKTKNNKTFYWDHIYLPAQLYLDLLRYESSLHQLVRYRKKLHEENASENKKKLERQLKKLLSEANKNLEELHRNRRAGDKHPRWQGWYYPEKRRPNNGFPVKQNLEKIEAALLNLGLGQP